MVPSLRYRHYTTDYGLDNKSAKGCVPCGATSSDVPGYEPLSFSLQRFYHADTNIIGSFGANWGMNLDVWMQIYPPGVDAGGHPTGIPGWQVLVSQPQSDPIDFLVVVDGANTGTFANAKSGFIKSVIFYKADDSIAINPPEAIRAQLTNWVGETFDFEIYEEAPGVPLARLTKFSDRNGNQIVSTWKYAITDPTLTGSLRTKLRIRDRLTDASGRIFQFTYDEISNFV